MDFDFPMIYTHHINILLSVSKSQLTLLWKWCSFSTFIATQQREPVNLVSPPYSNSRMKFIYFTRVSYVIQTAFSYLSAKFQLNVRQNLIMLLLNYTLRIETNLPILPWFVKKKIFFWFVKKKIFVLKCIVDFFSFSTLQKSTETNA